MTQTKRVLAILVAMLTMLLLCTSAMAADNRVPVISDIRFLDTAKSYDGTNTQNTRLTAKVTPDENPSKAFADDFVTVTATIYNDGTGLTEEVPLTHDSFNNRWESILPFDQDDITANYTVLEIKAVTKAGKEDVVEPEGVTFAWTNNQSKQGTPTFITTTLDDDGYDFHMGDEISIRGEVWESYPFADMTEVHPDERVATLNTNYKITVTGPNGYSKEYVTDTQGNPLELEAIDPTLRQDYSFGDDHIAILRNPADLTDDNNNYLVNGVYTISMTITDSNNISATKVLGTVNLINSVDQEKVDTDYLKPVINWYKLVPNARLLQDGDMMIVLVDVDCKYEIKSVFATIDAPKGEGDITIPLYYSNDYECYHGNLILSSELEEGDYILKSIKVTAKTDATSEAASVEIRTVQDVSADHLYDRFYHKVVRTEKLALDPDDTTIVITRNSFKPYDDTIDYEYEKITLNPIRTPEEVTEPKLSWTSSDPTIATVDNNGVVTAVAPGEVTITCTTTDLTNIVATAHVVVEEVKLKKIMLYNTNTKEEITGQTITLKKDKNGSADLLIYADYAPVVAINHKVEWTSSNPDVVAIEQKKDCWHQKLVVKGTSTEPITITATAADGSGVYATITVYTQLVDEIDLTNAEYPSAGLLNDTTVEFVRDSENKGQPYILVEANLLPYATPEGGEPYAEFINGEVEWNVECDENNAVDSCADPSDPTNPYKLYIQAKADVDHGTAVVTCTSKDAGALVAKFTINVSTTHVESIDMYKNGTELINDTQKMLMTSDDPNPKFTVTAVVGGEKALDKNFTWEVINNDPENPAVKWSKTNKGVLTVTAIANGTAVVKCTANDEGAYSVSFPIEVSTQYIEGITLSNNAGVITDPVTLVRQKGTPKPTMVVTADVDPDNALNPNVEWTVADESVATVKKNASNQYKCTITGLKTGSTIVNCWAVDQDPAVVVASMTVNVETKTVASFVTDPAGSYEFNAITYDNQNQTKEVKVSLLDANGEKLALNPADGKAFADFTFYSSDQSVVTVTKSDVDENGDYILTLTSQGEGSAYIAMVATDEDAATSFFYVTVLKNHITKVEVVSDEKPVTDVTLTRTYIADTYGKNNDLGAHPIIKVTANKTYLYDLTKACAYDARLTWTSSDPTVATVKGNDVGATVTAQLPGTTRITVVNEESGCSYFFDVTVDDLQVSEVVLTPDTIDFKPQCEDDDPTQASTKATIAVELLPANAWINRLTNIEDRVSFTNSNDKAVTVDDQGNVVVVSEVAEEDDATITVTVKDLDAVSADTKVTVYKHRVHEIVLSESQHTLYITGGDEGTKYPNFTLSVLELLDAEKVDGNCYCEHYYFESSDPTIVTVSNEAKNFGWVESQGRVGTAIITVHSKDDWGRTNFCKVTVANKLVSDVVVTPAETTLTPELSTNEHPSVLLTAAIAPSNALNQEVTWKTSNADIATIQDNGDNTCTVYAMENGDATITAIAKDTGKAVGSAKIHVVKPDVENIIIKADGEEKYAKTLTLKAKGATVDSVTLEAVVKPDNAFNKNVTWTNLNPEIVTLSAKNVVTPKAVGTATIQVVSNYNNEVIKTFVVTVVDQKVTSITLNPDKHTFDYSNEDPKTMAITATVAPATALNQNVTWKSTNSAVAEVSDTGVVTAHIGGECDIICTANDGSDVKAICHITVIKQAVTSIELREPENAAIVTEKNLVITAEDPDPDFKLNATVLPTNAYDKSIKFEVAAEPAGCVTVDPETGLVTATKVGEATVTCKALDGSDTKAIVKIHVTSSLVEGIEAVAAPAELYLVKGETSTSTLTITVNGKDAVDKSYSLTNSNPEIVSHVAGSKDNEYVLTAVAPGTATFTVKTKDGSNKTATATVTVKKVLINKIELDQHTYSEKVTDFTAEHSFNLKATIAPSENLYSKDLKWTTSKDSVAIVDDNGKVTLKGNGTATIRCAAADDSSIYDECVVTVDSILVSEIIVSAEKDTLKPTLENPAPTTMVKATVKPENASNKAYTWKTADASIATVDPETGLVTAVGNGTVKIYACALDNSDVKGVVEITVDKKPVDAINLYDTPDKLNPISEITITRSKDRPQPEQSITVEVLPADAFDPTIDAVSDNAEVAEYKDGKIVAYEAGVANITFKAGEKTNILKVTVVNKTVENVEIKEVEGTNPLVIDEDNPAPTIILTATVTPENASNTNVIWTAEDDSVVSIDDVPGTKNVCVTGLKDGTTVIKALAADGSGNYDIYSVTVIKHGVTEIKLNPTEMTLKRTLDELEPTEKITYTVTPEDSEIKSVTFSSSNPEVASVDPATGVVTAHKDGVVEITATANDGSGVTAICTVTVISEYVEEIELNATYKKLFITSEDPNPTYQIVATAKPDDAVLKTLRYKSGNTSVVTVDANGLVTAAGNGTAYVYIYAKDGSGVSAKVKIVVAVQAVTEIDLNYDSYTLTIKKGKLNPFVKLKATVGPDEAFDKSVTWYSGDKNIAKVYSVGNTGKVLAISAGTTYIYCKAADGSGVIAKCKITVKEILPSYIKLAATKVTLTKTKANPKPTYVIDATVKPTNAANQTLTYSSSDKTIAKVNANGVITGLKAGTAKITVKVKGTNVKAVITVTVK